jgi:hypothetical protein
MQPSSVWPIFIASKGRPDGKTFKVLQASSLFFFIFVEREDAALYEETFANNTKARIIVLPESNQGIGYVRQFILKWARDAGITWYWMMDDDITGFFKTVNRKTERISAIEALTQCQEELSGMTTIAQAALEYQQFAWSATKKYRWNSYCDVCVAINVKNTMNVNYRPQLRLKEDRDFTLQILAHTGYRTLRFATISFNVPKNGSNKGGCQTDYKASDRELEHSKKMIEIWPDFCSLNVKKDGRPDVKIHWNLFNAAT